MKSHLLKRSWVDKKTGKRKSAKTYSGRYRLPGDTRDTEVSLSIADKALAKARLNEIVSDEQRKRAGYLPLHTDVSSGARIEPSLQSYLEDLRGRGASKGHIEIMGQRVRKLARECNWKVIRDVTPESFTDWRAIQALAASTKNQYLEYASAFFKWMVESTNFCSYNPLAAVKKVEEKGRTVRNRRPYQQEEIDRLLAAIPDSYRLAYIMAFFTGLRRSELNALEWRHIKLNAPTPYLWLEGEFTKNGEPIDYLPLHEAVVEELKQRVMEEVSPDSKLFSVETFPSCYMVNKHLSLAGIPKVDENGKIVDLHALRHTLATRLAESGVGVKVMQAIMRHKDIRQTLNVYTHVNRQAIEEGITSMPALGLQPKESVAGGGQSES